MTNMDKNVKRVSRKRSPNYPFVSLRKALDYTKNLYDKDKLQYIPANLLPSRWNLRTYNSYTRQIIAALHSFGLIDIEGIGDKREVRVSESAYRIIKEAPDKQELLQQSALRPKLYREIWEMYQNTGLPNEDALKHKLLWNSDYIFNAETIDLFIKNFTETMAFANLDNNAIIDASFTGGNDMPKNINMPVNVAQSVPSSINLIPQNINIQAFQLNYPLNSGERIIINIPYSATKSEYEDFLSILEIMKKRFETKSSIKSEAEDVE